MKLTPKQKEAVLYFDLIRNRRVRITTNQKVTITGVVVANYFSFITLTDWSTHMGLQPGDKHINVINIAKIEFI
jgi:hypothetical protein